MKTIKENQKATETINKSEFIADLIRVNSVEEATNALNKVKKNYYDATHHPYAYILGSKGEVKKCSDDGEPSQTSGLPILNVLEKNELTNIICIVTRYFGGIKLGAGGLVRAYSQTAAKAVSLAPTLTLTKTIKFQIKTSYTYSDLILRRIDSDALYDKRFLEEVYLFYEVKEEDFETISKELKELTKNDIQIDILEKCEKYL